MSQKVADRDIISWDSKNLDITTEVDKQLPQKRLRNGSLKEKEAVHESENAPIAGEPDHDIHIWTERERRTKMRNMFSTLHSLIPNLPPKADKSTIVEAAISMIRGLETTIKKLQKKKMENIRGPLLHSAQHWQATCELSREALMADQVKSLPLISSSESTFPLCFQTWSSPNVVVSMSGVDVHINVCAVRKRGLMSNIVYSLEKHNLLVLSAHVSCDYFRSMFMIHAQANGIREPLEEIFMSAVGEIMAWIS